MIIVMRPDSNKLLVEPVARALHRAGYDVHIKNGKGPVLVAALGSGHIDYNIVSGFTGVIRVYMKNDMFNSVDGEGFVEDFEFFRGWD
jgi:hypothetical protein